LEAIQVKTVIERALVSFTGTSTSDGNVGGTTIVCSDLTSLPDFDGQTVMITEGTYAGQARDIDGATTGGTITVFPALGGKIVSGINFSIISGVPATKELADVQGTGFDTTTDSLVNIPSQANAKTLNATALASINAEVDTALNTAIPGAPTADSVNERIKALDDHMTADYGATEKAAIDLLDDAGYGLAALDTELGLIPQSGGTTTWNATALAAINAEVDTALNTAVPGVPTADSINERIKTLDDAYTATRAGYLDELAAANIPADVDTLLARLTALRAGYLDNINQAGLLQVTATRAGYLDELGPTNIPADTDPKVMGRTQLFQKAVTSAANAGDVILATITTQACLVKSIVLKAVTAVQTDLTSAAISGGAAKVITFINATDAAKANIDAIDEQVAWTGAVELAATKTIVISLAGVGVTAVNLLVTIEFEAVVSGGYLV